MKMLKEPSVVAKSIMSIIRCISRTSQISAGLQVLIRTYFTIFKPIPPKRLFPINSTRASFQVGRPQNCFQSDFANKLIEDLKWQNICLNKSWFRFLLIIGSQSLCLYLTLLHRYFKWLLLAAIHTIIYNHYTAPAKDPSFENTLALSAMMIWIQNGTHYTPGYHLLSLEKVACPKVFLEEDADPDDPDALTSSYIYKAGTYFLCDVVWDTRTYVYHIPFSKAFDPQLITQAYEKGTMNELQTAQRQPHGECTNNHTSNNTINVCSLRTSDCPLPVLSHCLDNIALPNPHVLMVPTLTILNNMESKNPKNPLKSQVQLILEQMFYDILPFHAATHLPQSDSLLLPTYQMLIPISFVV
ncbi:hypothetical protein J3R82DRAFT_10560 [Butyriboletus roseoflavus]|nr:hypothetical protein J3R82DRAFT_10560 [Butyriboletus roseoflavus]